MTHLPLQYITRLFTHMVEVSIVLDYFSVCAKREMKQNVYGRGRESRSNGVLMAKQDVTSCTRYLVIRFTFSVIIIIIIIITIINFLLLHHHNLLISFSFHSTKNSVQNPVLLSWPTSSSSSSSSSSSLGCTTSLLASLVLLVYFHLTRSWMRFI